MFTLSIFSQQFKKIAKVILILHITCTNMNGQQSFGSYRNKIFLNVYTSNPHSSITKFLNDFAPILLDPPEHKGTWSAYSAEDIPMPIVITHSYVFQKHPFIDAPFKQGEFKVYTDVYGEEPYKNQVGISSIHLILEFENFEDAEKLFDKCRTDLKAIAEENIYVEEKSRRLAVIYSDEDLYNIPCGIKMILGTERNNNSLYELRFQ